MTLKYPDKLSRNQVDKLLHYYLNLPTDYYTVHEKIIPGIYEEGADYTLIKIKKSKEDLELCFVLIPYKTMMNWHIQPIGLVGENEYYYEEQRKLALMPWDSANRVGYFTQITDGKIGCFFGGIGNTRFLTLPDLYAIVTANLFFMEQDRLLSRVHTERKQEYRSWLEQQLAERRSRSSTVTARQSINCLGSLIPDLIQQMSQAFEAAGLFGSPAPDYHVENVEESVQRLAHHEQVAWQTVGNQLFGQPVQPPWEVPDGVEEVSEEIDEDYEDEYYDEGEDDSWA